MKKLFAIIVFFLSSFYISAAEKTTTINNDIGNQIDNNISSGTKGEHIVHNSLSSFNPSIKTVTSSKVLSTKQDGKITISRRSQVNKKTREELSLKKSEATKTFRAESPALSSQAFGFSFFSATSFLDVDLDGDGYYSQFGIDFDADLDTVEFADVYAVIYYSEDGGPWTEFFVSEDFTIFSNDSSDEYSVTFNLTSDFPANEYDFLIDLFEVGFSDIVATIGPDDDVDLFALPLEDELNDTFISFVASDLFGDADNDGFYTDLTLEYDIDTQHAGDTVYAEIVVSNRAEGWQQILSTNDFTLGNQTEFIDLTFNDGYPADLYDIQINLIDSLTGEVIADAAQEFSSLIALPIESVNNDDFFDGPTTDTHVDVVVHGGGSFGWGIFLLGLLGLARNRK